MLPRRWRIGRRIKGLDGIREGRREKVGGWVRARRGERE